MSIAVAPRSSGFARHAGNRSDQSKAREGLKLLLDKLCYISVNNFPSAASTSAGRRDYPVNKPIYVYSHDANPAIDAPSFRISRCDAADRLAAGYVLWVSEDSVQLKPPPEWHPDRTNHIAGGLFQNAWAPRMSANYLVWQMRSDENG